MIGRAALVAVIAGLALAAAAGSAGATFPGRNGLLAVVEGERGASGGQRIVLIGTDGTLVRRIPCRSACADFWPAWSPDGASLAFSTELTPVDTRLGVVRADGSGRRTLPRPAPFVDAIAPAWSPDGRRLAFGAAGFDVGGIWTVNTAGRDVRRVSPRGQLPSWSVNGMFAVGTGGLAVWKMRADGSRERLQAPSGDDPDWSPGGGMFAYMRVVAGREEIWKRNLNGFPYRTRRVARGSMPSWAPDGNSIAFVRGSRIYIVGAGGKGERKVPYTPRRSDGRPERLMMPAWQPLPRG